MDTPYRRIAILGISLVAAVSVLVGVSMIARGFGGDEKRLATAIVTTLKEPYINGQVSLAQQSQTGTIEVKGSFRSQNLTKVSLDAKLEGKIQDQSIDIPVKVFADLPDATTYVHANNLSTFVGAIGGNLPDIEPDLSAMAAKIDGKWLRIQQKDSKTGACVAKLSEKLTDDSSVAKSFASIYQKNRFLQVDKVEKLDDRHEYTVQLDNDKLKSFVQTLQKHEVYTSIAECKEVDTAPVEATAPQTQPKNQAITVKLTVKDDKIINLMSVTSVNGQASTSRIAFNFAKDKPLEAPKGDIVEHTELQSHMTSIARIMQEQFQAAQQQGSLQQGASM